MRQKLRIDSQAILQDIRSGLGDVPIMEKHGLSPRLYRRILETLRANRSATFADVESRMQACTMQLKGNEKRATIRNYILYQMTVCNANEPGITGILNDISEAGLQVSGMDVQVDDLVTLMIGSDGFNVHSPFILAAICRWVDRKKNSRALTAGFEITSILGHGERELRKLVDALALSDSRHT